MLTSAGLNIIFFGFSVILSNVNFWMFHHDKNENCLKIRKNLFSNLEILPETLSFIMDFIFISIKIFLSVFKKIEKAFLKKLLPCKQNFLRRKPKFEIWSNYACAGSHFSIKLAVYWPNLFYGKPKLSFDILT